MKDKPVIGVLLGDPTGIGPEITAKLLTQTELYDLAQIVIIGDKRIFEMGQQIAGVEFSSPWSKILQRLLLTAVNLSFLIILPLPLKK